MVVRSEFLGVHLKHAFNFSVCTAVLMCCYLMHQQLSHLHVVVEGSQVQCGVTVILLLVHDPRPWQFG